MAALTVFSVLLLVGALLSDVAQRSVLSVAVLFLAGGFVLGPSAVGLVPLPADSTVDAFAKVALFAVLFTDGMRTSGSDLRHGWRLPGRAQCPAWTRDSH